MLCPPALVSQLARVTSIHKAFSLTINFIIKNMLSPSMTTLAEFCGLQGPTGHGVLQPVSGVRKPSGFLSSSVGRLAAAAGGVGE